MLCPKCGQEYEGKSCLRCDGPQIIINNEDYLRRRKAYEEKQAGNKSAFSDSANVIVNEAEAEMDKDARALEAVVGKVRNVGQIIENKTYKLLKNRKSVARIKNIKLIFAVMLLLVAVLVFAAVAVIRRDKADLYATSADKLYVMKGGSFTEAGNVDDVIFTGDKREYYNTSLPEEISGLHNVASIAAKDGRYFSTVGYDESRKKYSVYIWNEENCLEIISTESVINLISVSKEGAVVYTLTELVDDEGKTGPTDAYIFKPKDKKSDLFNDNIITELAQDITRVYVYEAVDAVICHTKNDELYVYTEIKDRFNKIVKDTIDCIYAWKEAVYTYYADSVNYSKDAKGFIYSMAGECYYCDLSEARSSDVYLGSISGAENRFVYVPGRYVYVYNHMNIKYSTVSGDEKPSYKIIAVPNQNTDVCYAAGENALYYVDDNHVLNAITEGRQKKLEENVDFNSLNNAVNDNGIIYTKQELCYYKAATNKKAVKIANKQDLMAGRDFVCHNGYIYFVTANGMLDRCRKDGSDYTSLGMFSLVR